MMMTEDQYSDFRQLIKDAAAVISEKLSNRQVDHDLLIEIKTILKVDKEATEKRRTGCAETFGTIKASVGTAHRRIDQVYQIALPLAVALLGLLVTALHYWRPATQAIAATTGA